MKRNLLNLSTFTALTFALLGSQVLASQNVSENNQHETIEVAFVLDTTGSMASLIAGAKQKIWSIANTIVDINPKANI
ncbi:MAG: VWA domain-containing protein, partial [Lentilitoribacter sp.]